MSQCRSCGAEILWAFTNNGARVPLNFQAENRFVPTGTSHDEFKMVKTWSSHFATCPNAAEHRKSRALKRLVEDARPQGETDANRSVPVKREKA